MDFIHAENLEKKLYTINYNNYLEWFLSENNLVVSVNSDKIIFQVLSLISLDEYIKTNFLSENYLHKFIYDLGSQILFLKENNIGISYFSLSDIVIINDNHFLFINPSKLFKKGKEFKEGKEFNGQESLINFIPPELEEKNNLSSVSLTYSSAYYSLAKLILHVFDFVLENLDYTSIYFFLKRCLEIDPLKRDFLFI